MMAFVIAAKRTKKANNPEEIIELCKERLEDLDYFINTKSNLKRMIDMAYSENEVKQFLGIIEEEISKITVRGLR